jgi:hypothetical protein
MGAGRGQLRVLAGGAEPAGRPPATPWREGALMVSDELLQRWETAYREFAVVSELLASVSGDRDITDRMARASQSVALAWREIAAEPDMPWWVMAATSTAAQAFEFQARDWANRAWQSRYSAGGAR